MEFKAYRITNAMRFTIREQSEVFHMGRPYNHLNGHILTLDNEYFILCDCISEQEELDILEKLNPNLEIITLYECEYCANFDALKLYLYNHIGKYHEHIFNEHYKYFLETARASDPLKDLTELLKFDTETYRIENNKMDLISAISDDFDEYENMQISRDYNEYGVPFYSLEITRYDNSDEIETPESLAQHDLLGNNEDTDTEQNEINEIEEKATKETEAWENRKHLFTTYTAKQEIRIRPTIETKECFVQITHNHIYKATMLTCTTTQLDQLKAIIAAREEIRELYLSQ